MHNRYKRYRAFGIICSLVGGFIILQGFRYEEAWNFGIDDYSMNVAVGIMSLIILCVGFAFSMLSLRSDRSIFSIIGLQITSLVLIIGVFLAIPKIEMIEVPTDQQFKSNGYVMCADCITSVEQRGFVGLGTRNEAYCRLIGGELSERGGGNLASRHYCLIQ